MVSASGAAGRPRRQQQQSSGAVIAMVCARLSSRFDYTLNAWWIFCKQMGRTNGAGREVSATIWTNSHKNLLRARHAERAFKGTNNSLCAGRKIFIAVFAVWTQCEHFIILNVKFFYKPKNNASEQVSRSPIITNYRSVNAPKERSRCICTLALYSVPVNIAIGSKPN